MLLIFLGSLVVAIGIFAAQFVTGHNDVDTVGDHAIEHGGSSWMLLLSVRFWSFSFFAFGLSGFLLSVFHLADPNTIVALATASGLVSGTVSAWVVRAVRTQSSSSHATDQDVVGKMGRVIVPLTANGYGKIRVELKGSSVDFPARATEPVIAGQWVVVLECTEGTATVAPAPKELN